MMRLDTYKCVSECDSNKPILVSLLIEINKIIYDNNVQTA